VSLRTGNTLGRSLEARGAQAMNPPGETGILGEPERGPFFLSDYQSGWPEAFRQHANTIERALGERALRVEHIGSTAVPGLAAKPIVDILLVVHDSADEDAYLPALEAAGYVLRVREPEFHEHRMFRTPGRDVHLHVYSAGSPEIERYLIFRDRLRQHPSDRDAYERAKRQLIDRPWAQMDDYANAKTEVIERIIRSARSAADS